MKFGFIAFSFLVISSNSYAYQCNTVMGGCPTDPNAGATSAHMRSENLNKAPAPQANTTTPSAGTKSSAVPSTTSSKKSQGSLLQTINKNVLK